MKTTKCLWQVSLLTLISILLSITNIVAQTEEVSKEEKEAVTKVSYVDDGFARLKWDVGTDLTFLLKDNYYVQGDILVRKNKVSRNKQWGVTYSAIRYRLQFNHNTATMHDSGKLITEEELKSINVSYHYTEHVDLQNSFVRASVGYEWQKYYGRFMMHYGYDVGLSGSRNKTANIVYYIDHSLPYEQRELLKLPYESSAKSWRMRAAPLVGFKYFIHPMISVSAESQLNIGYGSTHTRNYSIPSWNWRNYLVENDWRDRRLSEFSVEFQPIAFLGASFHFNK